MRPARLIPFRLIPIRLIPIRLIPIRLIPISVDAALNRGGAGSLTPLDARSDVTQTRSIGPGRQT